MRLDLIEMFDDYINSQNLFAPSIIGLLQKGINSISILALPAASVDTVFYDGSKDTTYNFQVNIKSNKAIECIDASYKLDNSISTLSALPSENGSYEFLGSRIAAKPTMVTQDEQGYFIYSITAAIDIHIKKGVAIT